jgi:hypothetical protein
VEFYFTHTEWGGIEGKAAELSGLFIALLALRPV